MTVNLEPELNQVNPPCTSDPKQQQNGIHVAAQYSHKASVSFSDEDHLQHQVKQHQLRIHKQNSLRFSTYKRPNDLESKLSRMYSFLLVKYHWAFIFLGFFICLVLTGVGFVKQPLPSFLDPKKGFGARGEGTLTSQLIVMKNVNKELVNYQKYILGVYEQVKRSNRSDFDNGDYDNDQYYDDYKDYVDDDDYNYDDKDYKEEEGDYDESMVRKKRDLTNSDLNYNEITNQRIYKGLTGLDIISMMPLKLDRSSNSSLTPEDVSQEFYMLKSIENCDYALGLNTNLEYYFTTSNTVTSHNEEFYSRRALKNNSTWDRFYSDIDTEYSTNSDKDFIFNFKNEKNINSETEHLKESYLKDMEQNLLNLKKLKSLCKWDKKILHLLEQSAAKYKLPPRQQCYFSLPSAIALINNKSDCMDLTASDVRSFLSVAKQCYPLQQSGILYLAAEDSKTKSDMDSLLTKNDPFSKFMRLPFVNENICFKKNLMHVVYEYLIDRSFMKTKSLKSFDDKNSNFEDKSFQIKKSTLVVVNTESYRRNATGYIEYPNQKHSKIFNSEFIFNFYLENLDKRIFDDDETKLCGVNLAGIREEAAMRLISQEMALVALAILLIVTATLLYLKSVVISMMINLSVGLSIGVSFFIYRIVFDIDLFPFLNMMAAFLLLGIACDDVFVLFDSWYNEKAKIIMEDLPEMIEKQYEQIRLEDENALRELGSQVVGQVVDVKTAEEYLLPPMFVERKLINTYNQDKLMKSQPVLPKEEQETFLQSNKTLSLRKNSGINIELQDAGISPEKLNNYMLNPGYIRMAILTDEQMIRAMSGTLRHAVSSIFVTSFTTSAAFLTNFITKLPYVQLFGLFTGTCILVYFLMVITMMSAFVILYEKHIQLWRCKLLPGVVNKWEALFTRVMDKISLMNYLLVARRLPKIIIKFRFVFFSLFLVFGIIGMVAVFYKPQLKPPANWRVQFFQEGNLFENFEFELKDNFWSYVNEERRNLTNPEIFFVFGIEGKDTGRIFNPDDDGFLVYDKNFDFMDENSQMWINNFINVSIANRSDLFLGKELVKEWNDYLMSIQQMCYKTLGLDEKLIYKKILLPYKPDKLRKCRDEINSFLQNSSVGNFESLMSSFPRRIIFIAQGRDVTGILLRVNANRTFTGYDTVKEYYDGVKEFKDYSFKNAPKGFDSGWFISIGFALYDLQHQLISGTYSSLVVSMSIALFILLITSGNVIISILAIITISFSIADTIAVFVFLGWDLSILESVVIIMSVGLSVDFSCHYGVAYINADTKHLTDTTLNSIFETNPLTTSQLVNNNNNNKSEASTRQPKPPKQEHGTKSSVTSLRSTSKLASFFKRFKAHYQHCDKERFIRVEDIFSRVGSAVLMAAFTTGLAGSSMYPSGLISFCKMGQFLMLVMCTSYFFATFFFVPMCAIFGPTKNFGKINLKKTFKRIFSKCCGSSSRDKITKRLKIPYSDKNNVNDTQIETDITAT